MCPVILTFFYKQMRMRIESYKVTAICSRKDRKNVMRKGKKEKRFARFLIVIPLRKIA